MSEDGLGLYERPEGVGAAAVVGDGRDLLLEQAALVLAGAGPRHVVHLADHLVDGAVGDHHHPRRVVGHGEVSQQLPNELYFIVEILCSHGRAGVHQEDKVRLNSWSHENTFKSELKPPTSHSQLTYINCIANLALSIKYSSIYSCESKCFSFLQSR